MQGGFLDVLEYLIETAGAEIGCISMKGQSLIHIASLCGDEKIIRWILNRTGTHVTLWTTMDNSNALHCAAYCGSVPVLRALLESWSRKRRRIVLALKDSRGNTPLHLATINEHTEAVLFLMPMFEAINACGYSAQAIALIRGNRELAGLIAGYAGTVQLFLIFHSALTHRSGKNKTLPMRPSRSIDSQLVATSVSSRCRSVPHTPSLNRALSPRSSSRRSSVADTYISQQQNHSLRRRPRARCGEKSARGLKAKIWPSMMEG
ncbi:ankyrin repeat protein [Cooperia oncophora]